MGDPFLQSMSAHLNCGSMQTLFSLIESPFHPDFSALYQKLGIASQRFDSARNFHRALQK